MAHQQTSYTGPIDHPTLIPTPTEAHKKVTKTVNEIRSFTEKSMTTGGLDDARIFTYPLWDDHDPRARNPLYCVRDHGYHQDQGWATAKWVADETVAFLRSFSRKLKRYEAQTKEFALPADLPKPPSLNQNNDRRHATVTIAGTTQNTGTATSNLHPRNKQNSLQRPHLTIPCTARGRQHDIPDPEPNAQGSEEKLNITDKSEKSITGENDDVMKYTQDAEPLRTPKLHHDAQEYAEIATKTNPGQKEHITIPDEKNTPQHQTIHGSLDLASVLPFYYFLLLALPHSPSIFAINGPPITEKMAAATRIPAYFASLAVFEEAHRQLKRFEELETTIVNQKGALCPLALIGHQILSAELSTCKAQIQEWKIKVEQRSRKRPT